MPILQLMPIPFPKRAALAAIKRAVKAAGGPTALARKLGVKPPTVFQWLNGSRPVPGERCIDIEEACGGAVTRYELRPDIFGAAPPEAAKAA